MCKEASFTLTKNNIYWSRTSDSHSNIHQEHNLKEGLPTKLNIVNVEIFPPNNDYSMPLAKWVYRVDQDTLPSWYNPERDEQRTRTELKCWAEAKLKTYVNQNTGDQNTGHQNTGDWNSTNNSTGVFCTEEKNIEIFDVKTNMTLTKWRNSEAYRLLSALKLNEWKSLNTMSEEEKKQHPKAIYLGGYLKEYDFKEACALLWKGFTKEEKKIIKSIPNFNAKKFKHITGIRVF